MRSLRDRSLRRALQVKPSVIPTTEQASVNPMPDALDVVQALLVASMAGVWFAQRRSEKRARRRAAIGLGHQVCERCGGDLRREEGSLAALCPACVRATSRGYRSATIFFAGLAVFFGLASIVIVPSEFRRFGPQTALLGLGGLVGMVLLTSAIARRIHRARKELERDHSAG